jgi:sorting nexin-25
LYPRSNQLTTTCQELLLIPAVCRSRELRAFLSQQVISSSDPGSAQGANSRDFVTRIYNSVADGMEEFLGNIPVLDQLSVAGQNLISAATNQLATANGGASTPTSLPSSTVLTVDPTTNTNTDAEAEAELLAFENKELEPFVKPICDIFLEAFELNHSNNWLRGRAVVVVLHQLLGGTIERKVRDQFATLLSEDNIVKYVDALKDGMWPNGHLKQREEGGERERERTAADRVRSRREAGVVIATLVPEVAASVVGRGNAQSASRRLEAVMNNQRLK